MSVQLLFQLFDTNPFTYDSIFDSRFITYEGISMIESPVSLNCGISCPMSQTAMTERLQRRLSPAINTISVQVPLRLALVPRLNESSHTTFDKVEASPHLSPPKVFRWPSHGKV